MHRFSLCLSCVLVAGACAEDAPLGGEPEYQVVLDVLAEPVHAVDLLIVVDDSGSMYEEQSALAAGMSEQLFASLDSRVGNDIDWHAAVVSTNMGAGPFGIHGCDEGGDDGSFLTDGVVMSEAFGPRIVECLESGATFLVDVDDGAGGRDSNALGSFEEALQCMVRRGTTGCGFEQPLAAMRRALERSIAEDLGFLRDDALLAVVILSDEDDCSAFDDALYDTAQRSLDSQLGPLTSFRCFEFGVVCDGDDPRAPGARTGCRPLDDSDYLSPVQGYVDYLQALKPGMTFVSLITGDVGPVAVSRDRDNQGNEVAILGPSCTSENGEATPAIRLAAFAEAFPDRHSVHSICSEQLTPALSGIVERLGDVASASSCLHGTLADAKPTVEGIQPECRAYAAPDPGSSARTEIPRCQEAGSIGCFELRPSPSKCAGTATTLELMLHAVEAPTAGHVVLECWR